MGSKKLFANLEKNVLQLVPSMNAREFSTILYAYSVRSAGNPELYAAFDKKVAAVLQEPCDYATLSNVILYLMFRDNADEALWDAVIDKTLDNDDVIPLTLYKAFKHAKFYLRHHFPGKDIAEWTDKLWYPEQHWNALTQETEYDTSEMYVEFKAFLNQKCLVYPTAFMTRHNLLTLHYAFPEPKIAIQFHLKKRSPAQDPFEISQMARLTGKLLRYEGWQVLDLTEAQFMDWYQD